MSKSLSWLLLSVIFVPVYARASEELSPGFGYPGTLSDYQAPASLQQNMARFGMTAGWFKRHELPEDYLRFRKLQVNELPYLLYSPKRGREPVPMVIYFGGTGEHGTDLLAHFRQTTLFEKLTTKEFQQRNPCYIFAPMPPKKAVIRAALPGDRSLMADLVCDAMYAIIAECKSPPVDTNRLYVTGLSWGGAAAFELPCSFPGRFAASVPTSCIQAPLRIPKKNPGNYWMLYNENSYKSERSQSAIREMERIVHERGGEFRSSKFPDSGHDSWRKAWCEDAVWEWVFSKGVNARTTRTRHPRADDSESFKQITKAVCTSSIPGKDEKHTPERILDGLDATFYQSKIDAKRGDWVAMNFETPIKGSFAIYSGTRDGINILTRGQVETSTDGKRWKRVGIFSKKDGVARFELRSATKMLRILYTGSKPQALVLRKIIKEDK